MPDVKDYYKALGVSETGTQDEVKKAYRKLAREYHPDRNPDKPGAENRFKEIQEAYDTLGDAEKRKQYDQMRKNPFFGQGGPYGPGAGGRYYRAPDGTPFSFETTGDAFGGVNDPFGNGGTTGGFGDIFSRFFGGEPEAPPTAGQARRSRSGGRDVETTLRISFDQALRGGKTEVTLPDGETVRLTIPKGAKPGLKIRLKGRGQPGRGGQRGDLYVTFNVEPSPTFRREGNDLYTTIAIDAFEAMLGAARTVANAYGKALKLTIPAGTQPGEKFRLKGQGVETDKATGDLFVEVQVTIPKDLSTEMKEALRKAAKGAGLL